MRKMFSEKQIEKMIEEGSLSQEQIQEMLIGEYVRIMDAPESTTLTDEQIDQIEEGTFIGGEFLSMTNPVLFPAHNFGGYLVGLIIGNEANGRPLVSIYRISTSTKAITRYDTYISGFSLFGKSLPSYPSDSGTFVLKCVNGVLTWVEEE